MIVIKLRIIKARLSGGVAALGLREGKTGIFSKLQNSGINLDSHSMIKLFDVTCNQEDCNPNTSKHKTKILKKNPVLR